MHDMTETEPRNPDGTTTAELVLSASQRAWRDAQLTAGGGQPPAVLVGGEWLEGSEENCVDAIDPSCGEPVARVLLADATLVDRAVRAADAAQPQWAALGPAGRAERIGRLRERVAMHRDELAALDAIDGGLPLRSARADVDEALTQMRDWPGLAQSLRGDTFPLGDGMLHYTDYRPYGVVARIVPFNHPFYFAATTILPALLAGNTVVLKPAEQTALSTLRFGELVRETLPAGVVNIVTGDRVAGEALVTHPLVRRIAFTGSTATGLAIQRAAAGDQVRTVSLELGGKNPMLIFPDVDVETAVGAAVDGMSFCGTQGQSCGSTSRVFVHRDLHDAFVQGLADRLSQLRVGPAYADGVDVGPLVSERQAQRVRGFVQAGEEDGARRLVGAPVNGPGYFVAPTLFTDVTMDMRIAREEIFGPVVSVFAWDDPTRLLEEANALGYGLTASVWTNDLGTALPVVEQLQAGYVWVNDVATHYWGTPFGGWGDSGLGREESIDELASYLQIRAVHLRPHPAG
jgi:acyl-CoA reductase-like NAD-dependent aldehyde dehydrogenase